MKFEYNTDDYIRKINSGNSYFNTFLDKNTLAAGVLVLKPGEEDTQLPHESDEMYYILEGDGFLKIKNASTVTSQELSHLSNTTAKLGLTSRFGMGLGRTPIL